MTDRATKTRLAASAALLFAALAPHASLRTEAQTATVRLRSSAAFEACLAPVLDAFTAATGVRTSVQVGDPASTVDVDLVVGDDAQLTRVLEGGHADASTSVDVGYIASPRPIPADRLLIAVAAEVVVERRSREAGQLLAFLATDRARALFAGCSGARTPGQMLVAAREARALSAGGAGTAAGAARYAVDVVDWWLPACTMFKNEYREPRDVLGAPDAVNLNLRDGRRDRFGAALYQGFMSMGQGGYVTLDMGQRINDGAGADVRVYQITSGEEVTVYASEAPNGPFTLLGFRRYCGNRASGSFAAATGFCDFDLKDGGLTSARYLKIEDGEIYPCLKGGTLSEGADVDAVELLNQ
jgi:hypothetical protein